LLLSRKRLIGWPEHIFQDDKEQAMDNLIVRTILGFAFLMLVLALILFGTAGTLDYWQAWLYLADFALCTILITVYLAKNDRELFGRACQSRGSG
jgi:hypothetical protein